MNVIFFLSVDLLNIFTDFITILLLFYVFCFCFVFWLPIRPAPPELEDGVLTTGPPGKSWLLFFFQCLMRVEVTLCNAIKTPVDTFLKDVAGFLNVSTNNAPEIEAFASMCAQSLKCVRLGDTKDCSPQAPLSMGSSRQEYWSGSPFFASITVCKNIDIELSYVRENIISFLTFTNLFFI